MNRRSTSLSLVAVWPRVGRDDRPWVEPASCDAFVRTARRVCELYSSLVAAQELPSPSAELRIHVEADSRLTDGGHPRIEVHVPQRNWSGFDVATVLLPPIELDEMVPQARALQVLECIHSAVTEIGRGREWGEGALSTVYSACVLNRLDFQWRSNWKSSRDRRRQARCEFRIDDLGIGWSRVVVRNSAGVAAEIMSESNVSPSIFRSFKDLSKSLRWQAPDHLTMEIPDPKGSMRLIQIGFELPAFEPYVAWPRLERVDLTGSRLPVVTISQ